MPRTVLLVEDDSAVLAHLRRTLHGSTYRVLSARDGRPALEMLAIEPVDVIVCAATLSDTAGVAFLERVRLRHPQTIRILLTAEPEDEAARHAVPGGTVHLALDRPPRSDVLLETIARALEQREVLRETQRLLRAVGRQPRERQGCSPPRPR